MVFSSGTVVLYNFMLLCLLGRMEGSVTDLCKETGWGPANMTQSSATAIAEPSQAEHRGRNGSSCLPVFKRWFVVVELDRDLWLPLEVTMSYLLPIAELASQLGLVA